MGDSTTSVGRFSVARCEVGPGAMLIHGQEDCRGQEGLWQTGVLYSRDHCLHLPRS